MTSFSLFLVDEKWDLLLKEFAPRGAVKRSIFFSSKVDHYFEGK